MKMAAWSQVYGAAGRRTGLAIFTALASSAIVGQVRAAAEERFRDFQHQGNPAHSG